MSADMGWLEVSIESPAEAVERLSESLLELGALSVDVADAREGTAAEHAIFAEPDVCAVAAWPTSRVSALFAFDTPVAARMAALAQALELSDVPAYSVRQVAEEDWVRRAQSDFAPVEITPRLWVVPSWCTPPDPKAINLIIDPGLAFGTGSHPTTRLCLRWLDGNIRGGETVFDYGCGSGILAIAALKLGAAKALGIDVDSQALRTAVENARANNVGALFCSPEQAPDLEAQIIVANILANPLKFLAPVLARAMCPGGKLALSGVLPQQAGEMRAAYLEWFDFVETQEDEGWICISAVKR